MTRNVRALRGRLVVGALLAVALLVALALGFVWQQYEDAKREAARDLRARAILAATVFDTYFAGQLEALSAIAASPTVVAGDTNAMTAYFSKFRPGQGRTFTAGVGWIDLEGRQRATSDPGGPISASLASRTYFKSVVATGKPVVGEAIVARTSRRRLLVMGVPTRDERGRLTGVMAGGIVLRPSGNDARATDLGYTGLQVIDREGQQVTRRDLARPRNADLVARLRAAREGVIVDTRGLNGANGRVVAFATSATPGWTTVLDQPTSVVFADARRSLVLEALLVGAAAVFVLGLIAWALRRARRDLQRSRARVGRWARLTRSLHDAVDVAGIGETLATALAAEFPEATVIVVLDRAASSGEPGAPTVARGARSRVTMLDEGIARSIAETIARTRAPIALETRSDVRRSAEFRAAAPIGRVGSFYGVPLSDRDRLQIGAAVLLFAPERALGTHELALVQANADQAGHALTRVRRHEDEHDVAVLLQQSLLPTELSETEGMEVGAYYRAGALNTKVGGDWYDVVRRPDGIVHLTVGDVAGRGIEAAVLMGQLRNAFRAYALEHASPAAIVLRMGKHVGDDGMATMVCVTYDPYTRELAYASAGHLPPLVIDPPGGTITRLEGSTSGPLGWVIPAGAPDERASVPPGATLALYTDGLVERRASPLDEGIDRLAAMILATSATDPHDAVELIVGDTVGDEVEDDLALLLVRLDEAPGVVRIELPADPSVLRELRRRVGIWLTHRGLDEPARDDALLALSEACNNAIEHGYREAPGTIRVRLEHLGDTLRMSVEDSGSWRRPGQDATRGRGLVIIRSLMDETEILRKPTGTEVVLERRL